MCFHTKFKIICSNSVKIAIGNLLGITFNLLFSLDNVIFFNNYCLFQSGNMLSFHMFVSSSVSFTSVYNGGNGSFGSLGRFIPSYFFLLDVMVNGIVSFISHSDISLLVYRNATDFCILILYPAILSNSLMGLLIFWYHKFLILMR